MVCVYQPKLFSFSYFGTDLELNINFFFVIGRGVPGVFEAGGKHHPPQHHVRAQMSRHRLPPGLHRHLQSEYKQTKVINKTLSM